MRAGYLQAYLRVLRERGIDPGPLLKKTGIPEEFEFHAGTLVAAKALHNFILHASRYDQPGMISMEAGLYHAAHVPNPFSENSPGSVTLLDAIHRHNAQVPHHSPENLFDVKVEADSAHWRKRGRSPMVETEIFCVANLIGHVRTALGRTWCPDTVDVSVAAPELLSNLPLLTGVNVRQAPTTTSIKLSVEELGRSVSPPNRRLQANGPTDLESWEPENLDYVGSLRLVLAGYLITDSVSMAEAARAIGISSRTLQRRLQHFGLTYSELLSQVRFEVAKTRLRSQKNVSVTQVGFDLGYSDPGSFTRAFRRFAGVPPSVYRRMANDPIDAATG